MEAGIVQQIFNDHYLRLEKRRCLDARSRWAAWNIRTCRTPVQGYHVDACPNDDYRILLNNSCKHRACPQCGALETEVWLERQAAKDIRCPHHQIVFTSPCDLRELWRWNRKAFTGLYFRAAWHTLRELLGDERRFNGLPGAVGVFQSWGDELQEHLHLHFIITAGGLTATGDWSDGDPTYLLPGPVLTAKFRGKFLAYLRMSLTGEGRKACDPVLRPPPSMQNSGHPPLSKQQQPSLS